MVEIRCPFCEQTHERHDLHQLAEFNATPEEINEIWSQEEVREFMDRVGAVVDERGEETYECGEPLSGDGDNYCTREVDSPADKCWQHE